MLSIRVKRRNGMSWTADDGSPRLVTDLATVLSEHESGAHHVRVARHLLRHTAGGIRLIGIVTNPTEAVCFDPAHCCVYRLPVCPIGVHPTKTSIDWGYVADPRSWIDAHSIELTWIHPQYRALAEDDASRWRYQLETCPITPNI